MRKRLRLLKKRSSTGGHQRARRVKRIVRHPLFTIPTATFMILLLLSVVGLITLNGGTPTFRPTDSHIVIVSHDKKEQTVPSRAATVGELLKKINVTLNDGDVVEPAADTPIVEDNFRVNVYRAVPVTVIDGTQKTFAYSAAATPRSIVKQAGVTAYPEDKLELLPTDNFLTDDSIGERVVIQRATPVNVNLYGTPVVMRTHAKTVGDLLKEKNVKLGKDDSVQPAKNTPLATNAQVFLVRKGTQIVTSEVAIDAPQQVVEDASLTFGTTAVRQQGSAGKKVITYAVQLQNGQEVSRQQIQEVVTVQPVTQVVARGKAVQIPSDKQAVMALAGISPGDYAYVDFIISRESGWCPTKLQGHPGVCPPYAPASIPAGIGYGLGQATPGSKMAPFGADWQTSAVTQLKWATSYAKARFGSWGAAYNYWQSHHNW
ncbi:MAG TPA: ubiquitin-like domain-containing protein [Nevskiaceae bacterium]|nr:ubiquitin-like domain-containing protein [Nevskiaceae bacterium]